MVLILSGIECMTIRFPLQPLTAYFVVQCHKIYFVVVSELLLRNNSKLIVAAFFLVDNESFSIECAHTFCATLWVLRS